MKVVLDAARAAQVGQEYLPFDKPMTWSERRDFARKHLVSYATEYAQSPDPAFWAEMVRAKNTLEALA